MRRVTPAEAKYRANYHRKVMGMVFNFCFSQTILSHKCDGPMDPMHFIPKQILRREAKSRGYTDQETWELVWDARNGAPGCRWFHNSLDTPGVKKIVIPQSKLPRAAIDFCYDNGFVSVLDRLYPKGGDES